MVATFEYKDNKDPQAEEVETASTHGMAIEKLRGIRASRASGANPGQIADFYGISAVEAAATSMVSVSGVTITPSGAQSVAVGSTLQLTATVQPPYATNKNITWSSDNAAAATVSNTGLVTGVAAGTATIKAQGAGKQATVTVTVA